MGQTVRRDSEAGHLAMLNREDGFCRPRCALASSASISGTNRKLKFGPFELSSRERVLRHEGVVLPLGRRSLDILIYLAERPGEIVAKRELMDRAWPGTTMEETSLQTRLFLALRPPKLSRSSTEHMTEMTR
jgi:DNA-binding response OmpR family regulator